MYECLVRALHKLGLNVVRHDYLLRSAPRHTHAGRTFQDHSRSSLLVLDLGHIAFGRYDSIKGGDAGRAVEDFAADGLYAFSSPVPDGTGGAAPSSTRGGDESGVCEPGVLIDDPLSTNGQEDHTQNYWRLDVSGVQVNVRGRKCDVTWAY